LWLRPPPGTSASAAAASRQQVRAHDPARDAAHAEAKAQRNAARAEAKAERSAARAAAKAERAADNAQRSAERPSVAAAPAKPASTNSAELDLDQLVEKAMQGGKNKGASVSASDDPLLGL